MELGRAGVAWGGVEEGGMGIGRLLLRTVDAAPGPDKDRAD